MADLAVFYEHPQWFEALFATLTRRGLDWTAIPIQDHTFDPAGTDVPAPVILNRLAMSSFLRQEEHALFYSLAALDHWQSLGARVINGPGVLAYDTNKARQLSLFRQAGLDIPPTRVAHRREDVLRLAAEVGYPLVVKVNVGGSGAGIIRYDSEDELAAAVADGLTPVGVDGVSLIQGYVPARDARVIRCEVMDGKLLYALALDGAGSTFDLCPADVCMVDKSTITISQFHPPPEIVRAVERVAVMSGLDVGGIEYMVDDRDGRPKFYDLNAMSNFVAKPLEVLGWDPHERLVDWLVQLIAAQQKVARLMRYGFWTPVFGGWLRNVPDEHMAPTWEYTKRLCQRAEQIGYDLTLVAELNLNDIKGTDQPALDAWSTAAALAAVTDSLELMVAVRPNFHHPALLAKQAANIDNISNGRLALNVVSSWWAEEATSYGLQFDQHDDRYGRTAEWLTVVDGLWREPRFTHDGARYQLKDAICEPKPVRKPVVYAGGESEAAKTLIANQCDAYVMHGDEAPVIAEKIADMKARREKTGKPPMTFGMAAYAIVRDTEEEARAEVARITTLDPNAPGFANFDQWLSGTQLEREMKLQEYSVSNRGLRPNLIGTPAQIKDRIAAYEAAGLDLLLLQMSPQYEEMERFAEAVIK